MKPLDLTKPVQTRDGRLVEIITTKGRGDQPVVGFIGNCEEVETWSIGGAYHPDTVESFTSSLDLLNVPEKRTVEFWVNVYGSVPAFHTSKESANATAEGGRTACLHIVKEFTVGEGL